MHLPLSFADDATVTERSGAAVRALECDGAPYGGGHLVSLSDPTDVERWPRAVRPIGCF